MKVRVGRNAKRFCLWFWSSSPAAGFSGYAWYVYFNYGYVDDSNKDYAEYVRLVRGGQ